MRKWFCILLILPVTSVKLLRKEKRAIVGGSLVLVHKKLMFVAGQEQEPAAACCQTLTKKSGQRLHTNYDTTQQQITMC